MTKKYSDYMDEISGTILYDRLLSFGVFSKNLPPIFDSRSFAELCQKQNPGFKYQEYDYVRFDTMRSNNTTRELGIPAPMAYEKLCAVLKKHWEKIQEHFHAQTDSQDYIISRIHLQLRSNEESLFLMTYDDWRNGGSPKDDLPIGMRYIVEADISNCFQSIYTHSIPWALIGKEEAKKNKGKEKKWYNKIDDACQKLKYKETHGILTGPHAFNLISELILTVVDNELYEKGWRYIRHIDDFMCFVESEEKAEVFLRELSGVLRKYDLHLNHKKICIRKLPCSSATEWVRKLNEFKLITTYGEVGYKQVADFFSLAIELMRDNKENSAILNYAIQILSGQSLSDNAKRYCWKIGMQLCLIYPYLFPLMDTYIFSNCKPPIDAIRMFTNKAFDDGCMNENYEECCYAILFSLKYGFEIQHISDFCVNINNVNTNISDFKKVDNCLYKLFVLLYYKKRQEKEKLDEIYQHALDLREYDMDRNWLFIYETLEENDLNGDWKKLKHAKVSFLKSDFQYGVNLKR